MFEKYTEASRRAIFFAHHEAKAAGHNKISPEHLLLGMLHDEVTRLEQLFHLRQHESKIREKVYASNPKRESLPKDQNPPLTKGGKQVLSFAAEEGDLLRDKCIDSEHLLLGILRLGHSTAAQSLIELGMNIEQARNTIQGNPAPGRIREQPITPIYMEPKESRWNFWGLVFLVLLAAVVIVLAMRLR